MEVRSNASRAGAPARDWKGASVLLVGCGSIGRRHARVLASLGVTDLRVYDPDPGQVKLLQSETPGATIEPSLEEALKRRPFAAFILTPPATHIDLSIRALEAGCNVFCEKPLSLGTIGLDELERAVAHTRRTFAVGLCFRYHPGVLAMRERLRQGAVGRLVSIRGLMGEHLPSVRPDYRELFSSRYLGAFDLMHDIDLALWFAGSDPVRAVSIHGNYSDLGIEAPDTAEVLLEFPNRCVASVHLDFFQIPRRRYLELIATEGMLRLEFGSWDRYRIEEYRGGDGASRTSEHLTERDEMFRAEDQEFLQNAVDGALSPVGLAEGRRSIAVLGAIYPEVSEIRGSTDEPKKRSHAS